MKCIFAKYNSERLPKYQIVTKIVQDKDGKKYSTKEPVPDEAKEHLNDIFNNYKLLNENYNVNLVKPEREDNRIIFNMAEGVSLESLMLQAIDEGNVELFESLIRKYHSFIDTFVSKKEVIFKPCDEFRSIFGEWETDEPQDIIEIANIDLVFSNIFVHNDQFTLIDYEWVFNFEIPKSYIVWRAFFTFSTFHNIDITKYSFEKLFSKSQNEMFEGLDLNFTSYVRGEDKKYFLNNMVAKTSMDLNLSNLKIYHDLFIQLYIDTGADFNEESSIKIPISQNKESQEIIFDLQEYENIKNLRLDPLNDNCVIEIEGLLLINDKKEINLFNNVTSNACSSHDVKYFFHNDDPQIYFNDLKKEELSRLNKLKINICYISSGEDALYECLEILQKENQQRQKAIDTQTVLREELQKTIDNQQDTIDTQTVLREELQKITLKKEELSQSKTIINRLKRLFGVYKPLQSCRAELPNDFTKFFNNDGYLSANPDVLKSVDKKLYKSGLEHFCLLGFDEIFKGERILLEYLPFYNDSEYKLSRPDVTKDINNGIFLYSHYVHYLLHGHKEIKPVISYTYNEPILTSDIKNEIEKLNYKPLMSIIMPVYNVDPKWLSLAIKSIEKQWYDNWELCIADDKSTNLETINYLKNINNSKIKITFLEKNGNISVASNKALSLAQGKYIALMDNDDELTPDALYEVVKAINENGSEFIYSDEDKIEMDGSFREPHFKPDFAPDMFLSQNYLSHLGVIKKSLINKVGGFTIGLEGAQDYDLYLKVLEHTDKVYHIQKVLYHWRKIPGSTASEFSEKSYAQDAGRKALEKAMLRRGIKAKVTNGQTGGTYKIYYDIVGDPLVSIIIPFKDKPDFLTRCIESILDKTSYKKFEIIGISNNSEKAETFEEIKRLESLDNRIMFYEYNVPFNYSEINNYTVKKYAKGQQILFLNNDIEIISPQWIEELLTHSQRDDVGAVGAKLYYPGGNIQHAGLVMAPYTGHAVLSMYRTMSKYEFGYISRAKCINNYSAVTAACLMCKKSLFLEVGGFDAVNLKIAYNDIDLCLKFMKSGRYNIFTPYSEAYHYESISRGYEESLAQIERREKEKYFLKKKHPEIFYNSDPFYNINLTLRAHDSSVNGENGVDYLDFIGLPFNEKILFKKTFSKKIKNRVCVFSHFDEKNKIDDYVVYYLKELSKLTDIIFVSTAESLSEKEIVKIQSFCRDVIVKKNYAYDFGAWKSGLILLDKEINDYQQLIFCNDSVFGPLFDLESVFKKMEKSSYDIWSITDMFQLGYHLQSYFLVYNKKAFSHEVFKKFWDNFKVYIDKGKLIEINEIKFSEDLQNAGLKVGAYCSAEKYGYLNIVHYYWKDLIVRQKCPFIKKELLIKNPMGVDVTDWGKVIASKSNYNTKLIMNAITDK